MYPLSGNPLPKSISQIFENESFQILLWMKMQLSYQLENFEVKVTECNFVSLKEMEDIIKSYIQSKITMIHTKKLRRK